MREGFGSACPFFRQPPKIAISQRSDDSDDSEDSNGGFPKMGSPDSARFKESQGNNNFPDRNVDSNGCLLNGGLPIRHVSRNLKETKSLGFLVASGKQIASS